MTAGAVWDAQALTLDDAKAAAWAEADEASATEGHLRWLEGMPTAGHLLDIGCGWGRLTLPMATSRPEATVWGVDVSARMLGHLTRAASGQSNVRAALCAGHGIPTDIPCLDGAWSMLTFQHLPVDQQSTYLATIAGLLHPGAPIVVQFVDNTEPGPLSHPVAAGVVLGWCAAAGLAAQVALDPDRPTWRWLQAWKIP